MRELLCSLAAIAVFVILSCLALIAATKPKDYDDEDL